MCDHGFAPSCVSLKWNLIHLCFIFCLLPSSQHGPGSRRRLPVFLTLSGTSWAKSHTQIKLWTKSSKVPFYSIFQISFFLQGLWWCSLPNDYYTQIIIKKMNKQAQQQQKNNPLDTLFDKMDSRPINTRLGFLLTGWMQNQKKIETDITWNAKANWNLHHNNWLEEKATETIAFTFVVCPLLIKWWVMGGPIKPTTNWEAPMVACSVKQHIYSCWNTT